MVTVDWTISVGNILTVFILGFGALSAYYKMQGDLRVLRHDFANLAQLQTGISETLTLVASTLTQVAVQQSRIEGIEQDISDIKRGRGFVLDLPAPRGPQ